MFPCKDVNSRHLLARTPASYISTAEISLSDRGAAASFRLTNAKNVVGANEVIYPTKATRVRAFLGPLTASNERSCQAAVFFFALFILSCARRSALAWSALSPTLWCLRSLAAFLLFFFFLLNFFL